MHMGQVKPEAFGATVMDLAQRGHLTITETTEKRLFRDKKDWRFTRTESTDDHSAGSRSASSTGCSTTVRRRRSPS